MSFSKWKIFCHALLAFFVTAAFAHADENMQQDEMMRKVMSRLDRLEGRGDLGGFTSYDGPTQDMNGDSRAVVRAFDASSFDFGGFLTTEALWFDAEDGTDGLAFNASRLAMILKADVCEDISAFAVVHYSAETKVYFDDDTADCEDFEQSVALLVAWFNWAHSDHFQLQVGRFNTPMGIINIEYFDPVLLNHTKPQMLRPYDGQTMFPNILTGFNAHGRFYLGDSDNLAMNYDAFVGVYDPARKNMHFGARLAFAWMEHGMTLGLNFMHGARRDLNDYSVAHMAFVVDSQTECEYNLYGIDFAWEHEQFIWKSAYFVTQEETGGSDLSSRVSWYVMPGYRINDSWIVYYRYDYLRTGTISPGDRGNEHLIGVNWLPCPTVRIRLEWYFKNIEDGADSYSHNVGMLSSTVSF